MTPERPKVPSLREAAEAVMERLDRIANTVGSAHAHPSQSEFVALRAALAADAEEKREIVALLRHFHRELGFIVDGRFNERFEEHAAEFHRETGLLAPGKDDPLSGVSRDAFRRATYEKWIKMKNAEMFDRLAALLRRLEFSNEQ